MEAEDLWDKVGDKTFSKKKLTENPERIKAVKDINMLTTNFPKILKLAVKITTKSEYSDLIQ